MTEELFQTDAYLTECEARVTRADADGVVLDRTVFYAEGGGQPGDTGCLHLPDGGTLRVADARRTPDGRDILHVLEEGAVPPAPGAALRCVIDWERRHRHMRMHSCLHLLCSLVDGGVTGGSLSEDRGRLDFDLQDTRLDKERLAAELNRLVDEDRPLSARWVDREELDSQPALVRTLSVRPPPGGSKVRLMEVEGVDLQACGGTHVRRTSEIGPVKIGKIENKGRRNRRVNILFDPAPA